MLSEEIGAGRPAFDPRRGPSGTPNGVPTEVPTDPALDAAEREKILLAIDEGQAAARRGEHVDADDFVAELLARA